MDKLVMDITRQTLQEVGVDPDYIVRCIAMMHPLDVKPTYVKGYRALLPEQQELVSS